MVVQNSEFHFTLSLYSDFASLKIPVMWISFWISVHFNSEGHLVDSSVEDYKKIIVLHSMIIYTEKNGKIQHYSKVLGRFYFIILLFYLVNMH